MGCFVAIKEEEEGEENTWEENEKSHKLRETILSVY
jgi:hypothetical protein